MDSLPDELIYIISKNLYRNNDIISFSEVFPHLRFTLTSFVDYEKDYHKLNKKFRIINIFWPNIDVIHMPRNIQKVKFKEDFNKPIKNLPKTITNIVFNNKFNQPADGLLPPNLINLTFGFYFNQPITIFPKNLKRLCFGTKFNGLYKDLPKKLKHLKMFVIKPYMVLENLTDSIEWLSIFCFCNINIKSLPKNIKSLWIHHRHEENIKNLDYLKKDYPNLKIKIRQMDRYYY